MLQHLGLVHHHWSSEVLYDLQTNKINKAQIFWAGIHFRSYVKESHVVEWQHFWTTNLQSRLLQGLIPSWGYVGRIFSSFTCLAVMLCLYSTRLHDRGFKIKLARYVLRLSLALIVFFFLFSEFTYLHLTFLFGKNA